jgi:oxygen-independent coproporphyrinogen-3 oxidase
MSGIYIHIPFCKKACHYCNFHFSTQTQYLDSFVEALIQEMHLQKNYLNSPIETLYFGGGTPSLLNSKQLAQIVNEINTHFTLSHNFEFTLEANPDDINEHNTKDWKNIGVNRLSIGIQSFQPKALSWMNRAHTAIQSHQAIKHVQAAGIHNISTDLIYGTPHLSDEDLLNDIGILTKYGIPHISCYALTVEEKTALHDMILRKKIENVDTEKQARHFEMIVSELDKLGFEHYEISNFAKTAFRSKHNSNYWKGIPYLGLGPSAHSYNQSSRQWNVANNQLYIQSIQRNQVPFELENLDLATRFNEYMMISLRLLEGVDWKTIETSFGPAFIEHTKTVLATHINEEKIITNQHGFAIAKQARFLADGIASDYFIVD